MEQKKRGKKVLLTVVTIVLLAVVVCGGYELWMYEHPEIQIRFNRQQSEGIDRIRPVRSAADLISEKDMINGSMSSCASTGRQPTNSLYGSQKTLINRCM